LYIMSDLQEDINKTAPGLQMYISNKM
jgi:hypothetical protein